VSEQVDVVIVGAGPSGLTLANILGLQGVRTLVVEERDTLIDYPRGVGLDDEALRTFQSIGLVEQILPHTVPNQILRFFDARRRLLAEMAPPDARFGWPKRNGFVQPLVDAELYAGLDRFDHVEVRFGHRMATCSTDDDGVTVEFETGQPPVRARYVVGCDGGRSTTRRLMGVSFDGTTSSTRWLVVDVANDPLGHPNSEVGADPARPYVSIAIAHGIRRFEFMIRRAGRRSGVRQKDAGATGSAPGAGRDDPAPGVHPPLPHRRVVPQGQAAARRRRRAPDAGVAGAGLQQRHPRRRQPGLETRRGGQRARR
jgi:3-(3-hydroxy-phenyl)propionate hydroxylase